MGSSPDGSGPHVARDALYGVLSAGLGAVALFERQALGDAQQVGGRCGGGRMERAGRGTAGLTGGALRGAHGGSGGRAGVHAWWRKGGTGQVQAGLAGGSWPLCRTRSHAMLPVQVMCWATFYALSVLRIAVSTQLGFVPPPYTRQAMLDGIRKRAGAAEREDKKRSRRR